MRAKQCRGRGIEKSAPRLWILISTRRACSAVETRLLRRRGVALDQIADALCQRRIIDHVEGAAAPVLAAPALLARQRALLIHVAEDDVALVAGSRDADLGMVVVRPLPAGEAQGRALP